MIGTVVWSMMLMAATNPDNRPPPFAADLASVHETPGYVAIDTEPDGSVIAPSEPDTIVTVTQVDGAPPGQPDIVVTARHRAPRYDPLQAVNKESFKVTQAVDTTITRPAALAYARGVPSPIRDGLRNFFLNLHEVDVFLNFLVQLKPGKAAETAGRFAINSTIGLAGLVDVARRKPFRLPRRSNGLGTTLGYYGVGTGPFFYLPLIGPTTLRDFVGRSIDGLVLPTIVGKPFTGTTYTLPSAIVRALDHRAENDERLTDLQAASDPYAATRADYLRRRQAEIDHLKGRD